MNHFKALSKHNAKMICQLNVQAEKIMTPTKQRWKTLKQDDSRLYLIALSKRVGIN